LRWEDYSRPADGTYGRFRYLLAAPAPLCDDSHGRRAVGPEAKAKGEGLMSSDE
jgi:hypothetical protein